MIAVPSNLKIRKLIESDYEEILVGWWNKYSDRGWQPMPQDWLPDNGTGGFMVEDTDGNPICAGFLYDTNSAVAWLELIISDRDYPDHDLKGVALDCLIGYITMIAKKQGYHYVYSILKDKGLLEKYKGDGFLLAGEDNFEMLKIL